MADMTSAARTGDFSALAKNLYETPLFNNTLVTLAYAGGVQAKNMYTNNEDTGKSLTGDLSGLFKSIEGLELESVKINHDAKSAIPITFEVAEAKRTPKLTFYEDGSLKAFKTLSDIARKFYKGTGILSLAGTEIVGLDLVFNVYKASESVLDINSIWTTSNSEDKSTSLLGCVCIQRAFIRSLTPPFKELNSSGNLSNALVCQADLIAAKGYILTGTALDVTATSNIAYERFKAYLNKDGKAIQDTAGAILLFGGEK